jgi:carbonic anhydrase
MFIAVFLLVVFDSLSHHEIGGVSLSTAAHDGKAWSNPKKDGGSPAGHFIHWHTIADQKKSVADDVRRIRHHPLVPGDVPIYGFIYDVKSGRLVEVKEATEAGRVLA